MAIPKDRVGEYKNVSLEEQDAVELRKAVATGSVKEPLLSSASALWSLRGDASSRVSAYLHATLL